MKTYVRTIITLFALTLAACSDVIEVPVQTAPVRLVIEASIDWEKGTAGNEQTIRLGTSSAFFDVENRTAITGASVMITNDDNGDAFPFTDQNNGEYTTTNFVPIIDQSYTLEVFYDGELYRAQETLTSVPDITDIYQGHEDGFDDEVLEIHVEFTDPEDEENYYLFKFQKEGNLLPELEVGSDEFVNGNEIDWWYEIQEDDDTDKKDALQPGDEVSIEMHGISKAYYEYMNILIEQIGGVGLFQATPVAVRGNCINQTHPENYAYGYFRLTEVNRTAYTVE